MFALGRRTMGPGSAGGCASGVRTPVGGVCMWGGVQGYSRHFAHLGLWVLSCSRDFWIRILNLSVDVQGVQASLIGVLPYAAIRLGVYDGLKWSHRRFTKQQQIKPLPSMLYGAFAGLLSASATFPVEVVR